MPPTKLSAWRDPSRRAFLAGALLYGRAPLFEYRYDAKVPKPYVHPLYLPDGRPVTLDGPSDHIHHRGLMLGWSDVNGFDFWGEDNPGRHGQILHRRFERKDANHIVAHNDWVAEGRTLLAERRELRASPGVWLEWTSELEAREPVFMNAEKHVYNGLGMRFPRQMDSGRVLNALGTSAIEAANGEAAAWCAYYGGSPVAGAAIFDHPSNPRHPNPFFVMNRFGYLSATPTFKQPLRLAAGERVRFRWGVLAFLGEPDPAAFNRRWKGWS